MDGLVQNIVCLDSSNCNQVNAFFNSLWKIPPPCFCFSLYHLQGAFHNVLRCTCSLFFFSIFHFLFTTFAQQPFLKKLSKDLCIWSVLITNTCVLFKIENYLMPPLPPPKKKTYQSFIKIKVYYFVRRISM